jgi:hypothetical protein
MTEPGRVEHHLAVLVREALKQRAQNEEVLERIARIERSLNRPEWITASELARRRAASGPSTSAATRIGSASDATATARDRVSGSPRPRRIWPIRCDPTRSDPRTSRSAR